MTYVPSPEMTEKLKYIGGKFHFILAELDKENPFEKESQDAGTLSTELTLTDNSTGESRKVIIKTEENDEDRRVQFMVQDPVSDEDMEHLLLVAEKHLFNTLSQQGRSRVLALYEQAVDPDEYQGCS